MIKIKHFMDPPEPDDGYRIWVEPIGVTRDLRCWCRIHEVWTEVAPPRGLSDWFEEHPDGYEYFRGVYHDRLAQAAFKPLLRTIVAMAERGNVTLLYQGENPQENSATALYEYVSAMGICE